MQDILRTVAYFTSVGQSMSAFHVWKYLYNPTQKWSVGDVTKELQDAQSFSERDGRFVLRGFERVFDDEHDKYLDADRKFRKARKIASLVSLIPGVRAVAVCNSLAWEATTSESDTDFLVICKPGTLWLARFLAVGPLILFKIRPGERAHDPIDFTFFISSSALDLSKLAVEHDDPYLAYWVSSLVVLIDDGVMGDFYNANTWIQKILPNALPCKLASYRRARVLRLPFNVPSALVSELNSTAKKLSQRRFPHTIREQMNKSSNVIVTDDMLKFHVHDDRIQIRDNWKKLYEQFS